MPGCVRYPAPGCIVEYMEGNAVQIAMVTEEAGGRLRLLLPNRRETRLTAARLLPWLGPLHAADAGREGAVRLLETPVSYTHLLSHYERSGDATRAGVFRKKLLLFSGSD